MRTIYFIISASILLGSCSYDDITPNTEFTLESSAFKNNDTLPVEFTCDGTSASPPIDWINAPKGTVGFAVTMHHIPGPGDKHVYMVIYNIPATVTSIPKNVSGIGLFGINTVNGLTQYTPPCSKGPGEKLYTLTVYALSEQPEFTVPQTEVTMDVLLSAISSTTIATATLNVTYTRS
jgi:phosphatidylethanolamine-binding protein (PEBP) family uncharacterized protein